MDDHEAIRRLSSWVSDNLTLAAGIHERDAQAAIDACLARIVALIERDEPKYQSTLGWFRSESVSAVTAARCASLCPGGVAWWNTTGAAVRALLLRGEFQEAETAQAELLSGPTDLDVDFNWPGSKLLTYVPPGFGEGDTVILGDGMGSRQRAVVVREHGNLRLRLTAEGGYFSGEIWTEAHDEAEAILGRA